MISLSPFLMLASLMLPSNDNAIPVSCKNRNYFVYLCSILNPAIFAVVVKITPKEKSINLIWHKMDLLVAHYSIVTCECLMSSLGITDVGEMGKYLVTIITEKTASWREESVKVMKINGGKAS